MQDYNIISNTTGYKQAAREDFPIESLIVLFPVSTFERRDIENYLEGVHLATAEQYAEFTAAVHAGGARIYTLSEFTTAVNDQCFEAVSGVASVHFVDINKYWMCHISRSTALTP